MFSRFNYVADYSISHYGWITFYCMGIRHFVCQLVDIWVFLLHFLLTYMHKFLCECMFFSPPIIYLGMELLGHVQLLWGTCQNVFQCDCLILLSHQQRTRIPGPLLLFTTLKYIFLIKKAFFKKCHLIFFFLQVVFSFSEFRF